jgi:hypothetical protein
LIKCFSGNLHVKTSTVWSKRKRLDARKAPADFAALLTKSPRSMTESFTGVATRKCSKHLFLLRYADICRVYE